MKPVIAIIVAVLLALGTSGCAPKPIKRAAALPPPPRFNKAQLDAALLAACERFKADQGHDRVADGQIVFDRCLPAATIQKDASGRPRRNYNRPSFIMTRPQLVDLIGKPDAVDGDNLVYHLGGRDATQDLRVQIFDGRVKSSALVMHYE